jgi:hypothetical protein
LKSGTALAPFQVQTSRQKRAGERKMEMAMTQAKWWLLGAVLLGIAIFVYLVFFCPTECH